MKKRALFILSYWVAWLLMFLLGRLFFLYVTRREANLAGFEQHWESLIYGMRMDASMATYITIPVILLLLFALFFDRMNLHRILKWYSGILLTIAMLIYVADAQSFRFWGFRIDASILNYLSDPKEAAASTAHFPLLKWAILYLAALAVFILSFNKLFKKYIPFPVVRKKLPVALLLSGLIALSLIPLRGGLQLAPINQSSVYFSHNNYANQAALNPVWNFSFSIKRNREVTKNPYIAMPHREAEEIVKALLNKNSFTAHDSITKKNVILVVWESFTAKVVDSFYNGIEITPAFNRLKNEGIWFSNAYATGDRTDKGIVGILSGYPSQPIASIVKNPGKTRSLPHLSKTLGKAGYNTSFYYGGEMEFANIKSFLLEGDFHTLVDVNAFERRHRNSKWGVHDGIVKDSFERALNLMPPPFFTTWLTLSSHEPFETPVPKVIRGNETVPAFLNSLHYTDQVIGEFVAFCRNEPWWQNTILVIIADHGHRYPLSSSELKNFHIPALILGGGVIPAQHNEVISQTGLPSTILRLNGINDSAFVYSKDWLQKYTSPWAFFSFNNGFGYLKNDSALVYDNIGGKLRKGREKFSPSMLKEAKALQQVFFQDFLDR